MGSTFANGKNTQVGAMAPNESTPSSFDSDDMKTTCWFSSHEELKADGFCIGISHTRFLDVCGEHESLFLCITRLTIDKIGVGHLGRTTPVEPTPETSVPCKDSPISLSKSYCIYCCEEYQYRSVICTIVQLSLSEMK